MQRSKLGLKGYNLSIEGILKGNRTFSVKDGTKEG